MTIHASAPAGTALRERFEERSAALGVRVQRVTGSRVAEAVVAAFRERAVASAIVASDLPHREEVAAALVAAGVTLLAGSDPKTLESAQGGVSAAAFGVAETGSVAVVGDELQPRLATMLPAIHVVVLDGDRLLPGLDEAGAEIERLMKPGPGGTRYVSLVTGPSRTADVEKTLAVGVHGPREVVVILVGRAAPPGAAMAAPAGA